MRMKAIVCALVPAIAVDCSPRDVPSADTGHAAPPRAAFAGAFRALGTEPFWNLDIDSAGMRFRTPEDTAGIRFPAIVPRITGDTMHWQSPAAIDVRLWPSRCSDGMSDREWAYTAIVRVNGTTYRGCAERRAAAKGL